MTALVAIDTMLRGAAIAFLFLTVPFSWWRERSWAGPAALLAVAIGVTAYILKSSPHLGVCCGDSRVYWIEVPAALSSIAVWWAGQLIFLDGLDARPWRLWVTALSATLCIGHFIVPALFPLCLAVIACLYVHLLWLALRSESDDLVLPRRRFRRVFLVAASVIGLGVTVSEYLDDGAQAPPWVLTGQALVLLAIGGALLALVATRRPDLWPAPPDPSLEPATLTAPPLNPAETALLARLERAMSENVWREEGLTIGALAARLDAPEHRLRKVINGGLGHRNFASFVNGHRIAAAEKALADPNQADTPVLTLAYQVGFASLGPFNRAFRDATGLSPTEYRRRHSQ